MLGRNLANLDAVVLVGTGVTGVDDVGDVALPQSVGDLIAAVADLTQGVGADAVLLQEGGSAGGGLDVEAQLVEPADQRQGLLLVLVGDGVLP